MASSSASAESVGSSTLSVRVKDVIAIRILDDTGTSSISTLGIDIAPTPNGSTVTKNAIVDVATSNETGYTLYMDSDYKDNDDNDTTSLINTNPTVEVAIPTSISTSTNFWNYKVGSGNATIIPTHGTPDTIRDDVTEPSDSSMTTIGINVNVDNDIPSGTYKNKLVFTATANYVPVVPYMQTFTLEECEEMSPGETVNLVDSRDGNEYGVVRMPDGTCWMNQNLRLKFKDVNSDGVIGVEHINGTTETEMTSDNTQTAFTPNVETQTSSPSTSWGDSSNSSNVQHSYAQTPSNMGVYYNWYTATAGTGLGTMKSSSATSLVDAAGSICPKGWELPKGGSNTSYGAKSWASFDVMMGGNGSASYNDATVMNRYLASPYNFLYNGYYLYSGGIYHTTDIGLLWSGSASTDVGNAYYFGVRGTSNVTPVSTNGRVGDGYAVRCVQLGASVAGAMQDFTCSKLTYGSSVKVRDSRDDNVYTVTRIPTGNGDLSGKCFMNEDLHYGDAFSETGSTGDTFGGMRYVASNEAASWSATDSSSNKQFTMNDTSGEGLVGYYSYGAALSACPSSWSVPTGSQYQSLLNARGTGAAVIDAFVSDSGPFRLRKNGVFINTGIITDAAGYQMFNYWTSTAQSTGTYASYFRIGRSGVMEVGNDGSMSVGHPVRCIK